MIALLQRLLLLVGLCAAAWHFWDTPARLIGVRAVDFQKEYETRYGPKPRYSFGAMAAADALIRQTTNPGSAAAYRAALIQRSIPPDPSLPAGFAAGLNAAASGRGPFAHRYARPYVYFESSHPSIRRHAAALADSLHRTSFLNAYTQAGGADIELMLFNEPHSSSAPAAVVYPLRAQAWRYAAAALVLYFLLGLAGGSSGARHDPLPIAALDIVAASTAAFFFGLPLRVCDSTQAVLDDPLSGPAWSWAVSLLLLSALFSLARRAAWRLEFEGDSALRLRSLYSSTSIPLSSVAGVTLRSSPDGAEFTGVGLHLADGRNLSLDWAGLIDFLPVLEQFRRLGLLHSPRAAECLQQES